MNKTDLTLVGFQYQNHKVGVWFHVGCELELVVWCHPCGPPLNCNPRGWGKTSSFRPSPRGHGYFFHKHHFLYSVVPFIHVQIDFLVTLSEDFQKTRLDCLHVYRKPGCLDSSIFVWHQFLRVTFLCATISPKATKRLFSSRFPSDLFLASVSLR